MANEKIITVVSSEVKASKTPGKTYLEVIDQDKQKYACWGEALWNCLGKNASAKIQFEQKGIFKNIVAAESITAEDVKKTPPQLGQFEPQEVGMWYKEVGKLIVANKALPSMEAVYYTRMYQVLHIPADLREVTGGKMKPEDPRKPEVAPTVTATFTTDDLLLYCAGKMNFKTPKTSLTWLVNKCKIEESRIKSEPDKVKAEAMALMGWTD